MRFTLHKLKAASATLPLLLAACGSGTSGGAAEPAAAAPTVVINDNVTGATATAPVLFTFSFSADVGSSFSADDIAVTGGTAGAFTRVSGTQATLVVTPDAIASGTLNVSVGAGKVTAANNRSNVAAATLARNFTNAAAGDWALDWSDEFDGTALNTSVWNYDLGAGGWGNGESEYYQAQNATVGGGLLTITAKKEAAGDAAYTSARIQTSRNKTFTYGRFEIRARLPATQGMWPAFWLLGAACDSFGLYGGNVPWPACGEIDAMEMIGGLNDGSGDYTTHGTLHYLNAAQRNPAPSFAWRNPTKLSADFHIYTMDWTPHSFTWYIDGVAFGTKIITADMTAFNKPFFLVLNLAVGGAWGGWTNASTVFPQTFAIDYVRHYTRAGPVEGPAAGLPTSWHLTEDPHLNIPAGTKSGAQPIVTLGSAALSWYTPYLTGTYDAGAWSASIWTPPPSGPTPIRARIFRQGSSPGSEVMIGETIVDASTTGSGNHITKLTFTGMKAITLSGESVRLELTKMSGPNLSMIVNGNDFDSQLSMPWSATGTYAAYPAAAAVPF